ncbi:HNH endonuclease signature motif containing protein [Streptomyces tendae]|uniref:HNH endonuclease signature motif containing protein n=1 Tax=Streptomyces tendae TaxID=1932 RepID=UPI0037F7B181
MKHFDLNPVRPSTPCVVPPATKVRPNGNGYFRLRGTNQYAHRAAYELARGPIPDGLVIDHLCRNTACANPEHLEAVPPAVNALRADSPVTRNAVKETCDAGHPFSRRADGRRWCPKCSLAKRVARGETSGNGPLSERTHCPQGHPFDEENTRYDRKPDGSIKGRRCRACRRIADQAKRRKAAVTETTEVSR